MIKLNFKSPISMGISSMATISAWASSGFATDPKHVGLALSAGLAGAASPNFSSSKPNVQADSHIITPYVNNVEQIKE
jgi:hypothetical protein